MTTLNKLCRFLRAEAVLTVSALLAAASILFVPPDRQYLGYIDPKVLAVLFCLMAVVAGVRAQGVFDRLSAMLAKKTTNGRIIALLLVILCFFLSALITNDVALITLVPFTVLLLGGEASSRLIWTVVCETVAANLGSMLTPIGNPQNLYLYSYYSMSAGEFFSAVLPLGGICLLIVAPLSLFSGKSAPLPRRESCRHGETAAVKLVPLLCLFALCLCCVLGLVSYLICLGVVLLYLLLFDRGLFLRVDYSLLLTFICFFILVGNLGRIEPVSRFVTSLLAGRELLVGAGASQIISNVPAAAMLAPFTDDSRGLLLGVNIGGLGTPIASMASLISYRLYCAGESPKRGRYLLVFSAVNFSLLALLLFIGSLIQ